EYFINLARYLFLLYINKKAVYNKYTKNNNYSPFSNRIIVITKITERIHTNYFYKGKGTNYTPYKSILCYFLLYINNNLLILY
ncbi:hypothetical protein QR685DRAFT_447915, partial [Neurospora intermedia]